MIRRGNDIYADCPKCGKSVTDPRYTGAGRVYRRKSNVPADRLQFHCKYGCLYVWYELPVDQKPLEKS